MAKGKRAGRFMKKKELARKIQDYFESLPGEDIGFKRIFKDLKLTTHPLKMLTIDIMEEMAWDDYLARVDDTTYRLNTKGQVQVGTFMRKANGKNTFLPDDGGTPIFVPERNSKNALTGDRVEVQFLARRQKHIKEAMVIRILERKRDTFVGRLSVHGDVAFLITQETLFTNDILIPPGKLGGGKPNDKAVVKITQWPDEEHKTPLGEVIDVLGQTGNNDTEMHTILAQYGLP